VFVVLLVGAVLLTFILLHMSQ